MKKLFAMLAWWVLILGGAFFIIGGFGNASNPQGDVSASTFVAMGIMGIAAVIGGITGLSVMHRRELARESDLDGDGIRGDGLPASKEQKALIQRRFRDMGEYMGDSTKNLTQGQAREILRNLGSSSKKKEE